MTKIEPGISGPAKERKRKRDRRAAAGAVVLLAAAGTAAFLYLSRSTPPAAPCPACVSWGQNFHPATPAIAAVESKIATENGIVAKSRKPFVTIALLIPLTYNTSSDVTPDRMADQLRAAYLAQLAMNGSRGEVAVRLLLADEGTSAEETAIPAATQLIYMESSIHLVAVAGMGVSMANTQTVAHMLGHGHHLAMFGAVATGDDLNAGKYEGYDQVVPNTKAQVGQLGKTLTAATHGVLVYSQQATDVYTANLKADMMSTFRPILSPLAQGFTPGVDTDPDFQQIADETCYTSHPPYLFFAGRAVILKSLIQQFQLDSNCANKKIVIVTGADGDGLPLGDTLPSPSGVSVSVIYTNDFDVHSLTAAFTKAYEGSFRSSDPGLKGLTDTWTIGTYNAMEAAWIAIEDAFKATTPDAPGKANVLQESTTLNGESSPDGATGRFSLTASGQLYQPVVPVYEDSDGNRLILPG